MFRIISSINILTVATLEPAAASVDTWTVCGVASNDNEVTAEGENNSDFLFCRYIKFGDKKYICPNHSCLHSSEVVSA